VSELILVTHAAPVVIANTVPKMGEPAVCARDKVLPVRGFGRFLRVNAVVALMLLSVTSGIGAQESNLGRSIYERNSESVALLVARDSSGVDVSLGLAFWVASKILVTNAHVVDAGKIFVKLGPVRLPCTVVAVDHHNDLATLTIDAEVAAIPVKLSTTPPKPGDVVFVIGNPEGLERAISQGIVSGIRKADGRELIQNECTSINPIEMVGVLGRAVSEGRAVALFLVHDLPNML
jgi:S1-C subfamily serine protease